jgi:hypothetical protein|tara:strand:- start:387 stop:626 length:240 start_codon:yes stop_codon:yes gene_type:complete
MTNEFWVFAIVTFLFALSVKKYIDLDSLRESIENYLAEVSPQETIEEEDLVGLEEIRDMIEDFVVRNPEIFSRINIKDE